MERKLSQKALRMRQRFAFTRSRDRASTMDPPSGIVATDKDTCTYSGTGTSIPSSRPRSAASSTAPVSSQSHSISTETAIDLAYHRLSADSSHHFHFTDEPGYFRPASPLINRQSIPEELEDHVKHACALLVQSIDRGLPIWPSFQIEEHQRHANMTAAKVSSPNTSSRFYHRHTEASMSPPTVENNPDMQISPDKWHDSGVTFQHSAASATSGRFYSRQATSAHRSSDEKHSQRGRSRSRDQSFAMEATPTSRSRSRSLSLDMFPYSPPQVDTLWPHIQDTSIGSSEAVFPETATEPKSGMTALDVEGMDWLRPSREIQHVDPEKPRANININISPMSAAAPRRFYSTRQAHSPEHTQIPTHARWSVSRSRTPSIDGASSEHSFSSGEVAAGVQEKSLYHLSSFASSNGLEHPPQYRQELIHQHRDPRDPRYTAVSSEQGQRRRKKTSHFLRKLTGLGRKKDVDIDGPKPRCVVVAVSE